MKQFGKILKFEFLGYLKNKAFVGITIFLVIAIVIAMFIPNMIAAVGSDETKEDRPIMLLDCENEEFLGEMVVYFGKLFPDYEVKAADGSTDDIKTAITDEKVECAFVLSEDMKSYTYYVNTLVISDSNQQIAESALVESYKAYAMAESGLSNEQISSIMNISFSGSTECLGANQTQNFIYTYVMIVALYAVIMLYGQLVATNVASEKSSRAMEVLVTSANPMSMMFGKVFASCLAGFSQLTLVFGTAIVCYNINSDVYSNPIISSIFNMPLSLLGFMLIFFVFIYICIFVCRNSVDCIKARGYKYFYYAGYVCVYYSLYRRYERYDVRYYRQHDDEDMFVYSVYSADGYVYENCIKLGCVV